jgi:DNA-binding phage protein
MPNINKLRGKIVEKGINVSELAKTLGINKSTLYRKLKNNGEDISIKEANLIIKELNLTIEEVNAIFFSQFVAYNAKKMRIKN